MKREEIIKKLSGYFGAYELVDERTWNTYGSRSWQFFNTDTLHVLLLIREGIDKPIIINNWRWQKHGIIFDERGLRTNVCDIVKGKTDKNILYLSGHVLGIAIDFHINGMDAEDVRNWIIEHEDIFPCKIRLEHINTRTGKPINWVHYDTRQDTNNPQIYLFDV